MRPNPSPRLGAAALCLLAAGTAFSAEMSTAVAPEGKAATTRSPGKGNGSGVLMRPVVPAKIALGEWVTLELMFSGVTATDGATVEVRDRASRTTLLSLRLAQGEQRTIRLPYGGLVDGMQFIDITTTQGGRSTVSSLPLRVGSGEVKLKPGGHRRVTAAGEAVISLPAASPGASH